MVWCGKTETEEVATAKGRESARDGTHTLKESTLHFDLIRARGEVAVEKQEGLVDGRDGVVPTTLDVTPTVSGKRDVRRGEETKARRCVNDKSASHAALKVVEGDLTVRKRRESMLFISGKVSLLEANDIALGDEVDKGPEDKVLPAVAGDVGSVVREAVNFVRKKTRNEGGSGREGRKTERD